MEHNPYAGTASAGIYTEPERTSIAAIFSLICSLICCLPGLPLLGVVLGALAMIGIGRSQGRVGGRGLAVAGIVLGLLFTVAQIGIVIGGKFAADEWARGNAAMGPVFADLEAGQYDAVRAALGGQAALATDEELAAFRDAYQAELGSYVSAPQTTGELFGLYGQTAQSFQAIQGRGNFVPLFFTFDQGPALAAATFDPAGQATGQGPFGGMVIVDLLVVAPDGRVIELSDFTQWKDAPPAPGDQAADPEAADPEGDEPGDEGP